MNRILNGNSGNVKAVVILLVSLITIFLAFYFHFSPGIRTLWSWPKPPAEVKQTNLQTPAPVASAPAFAPAPVTPPPPVIRTWEKTIIFSPSQWSHTDKGWQKKLELEVGQYELDASGEYEQIFSNGGRTYPWKIKPHGARDAMGNPWISPLQYTFPATDKLVGYLIAKVNGKIIPIGWRESITITEKTDLYLSINNTQDNPDNFTKNRGGFFVKIKKIA
ncbi:MAG: hypothetical protein NT136_00775 [Candidatus Moranbacteria bacterium]|nr:hypothetical protein [Candidatus Moranbacteria bacterium]